MRHAIFSQCYKDRFNDSDVTCWWGVSDDAMSFLVIDATNGSPTDVAFTLATDGHDSRGTLECSDGIRCIDVTGTVLYVTEDCVGGTKLPMSASELASYLGGGKYPLSLKGVRSYLRDCSDRHLQPDSRSSQAPTKLPAPKSKAT